MKIWTPEDDLREFYQRSVRDRRSTGIPQPFEVQSDGQMFDTKPIIYPGVRKASMSVQDGALITPPTIDSFYPYWGKKTGGDVIDIYGSNFINAPPTVRFGGVDGTSIVFVDNTHIKATIPGMSFSDDWHDVDVAVSNVNPFDSGLSDSLTTFRYEVSPGSGTYLFPTSGTFARNNTYTFTIHVEGFFGGTLYDPGAFDGFFTVTDQPGSPVVLSYNHSVFVQNGLGSFSVHVAWDGVTAPNSFGFYLHDDLFGSTTNSNLYGVS